MAFAGSLTIPFFTLTLLVLDVSSADAQTISKKEIRGTYSRTSGQPGRTIQKNDSTFLSLPPMTYSKTILRLKRFGNASLVFHASLTGLEVKNHTKWRLTNDTLYIDLFLKGEIEKFSIDDTSGSRIILQPVQGSKFGFSKEK